MEKQPALKTTRLVLRPFVADDAAVVQKLCGEREIADTTLSIPHPYPAGAAEQFIATLAPGWDAGTSAVFAITLRESCAVIGSIGLSISKVHAYAELGYWVGVPYWNNGYCTEAALTLLRFGFRELGLHRIQARHLVRNPASGRVLQKICMQQEGVLRESVRKWDRFEDVALYAILATPPLEELLT